MKIADRERGARVRANLWRWRKRLSVLVGGWVVLALAVGVGAVTYARAEGLSQRRVTELAEGCALVMSLVLIAGAMVVLLIADRRRSE